MVHTLRFLLILWVVLASIGCAPNQNGVWQPALPWSRRASSNTASANPWTQPNEDVSSNTVRPLFPRLAARNNQRRSLYLNDLMNRAGQQEALAENQRKQLEELRRLQSEQQQQDREYIIAQRKKERETLENQFAEKAKEIKGRYDQLRGRASNLDANNRDLHAQLARSAQQRELLQDEIDLLKQRLNETTRQLTQTREVGQETGRRLQALQASSTRRPGGAEITANSSLNRAVTAVMVPGMDIRQDNDLVRITIPTDKLFMAGTASLHQGSQAYMDQVANVIKEYYPRQIVGVEAHTDLQNLQSGGTRWRNSHQLTAAQAMAVFEQLTSRNIASHQLFVQGYGGNHPRVSSGTAEGQFLNRRIEIVVYPETYAQ